MAIDSVTEKWDEMSSGIDQERGYAVLVYDVDCDDSDTTSFQVLQARDALGIPLIGDAHLYDQYLFCKSKDCTPTGPHSFKVTCNFESIQDPVNQPVKISMSFATSTEAIDKDYEGNPILMSNGETPDPPISREVHDQVYRYEFNDWNFDDVLAAQYQGAINSDAFKPHPNAKLFQPDQCKIITFTGNPVKEGLLEYFSCVIEIQVRDQLDGDTWKRRILDQGYRELNDDGDAYITIVDDNGNPLSQPSLLDGEGRALSPDADPVYNEYYTDKRLSFSTITQILRI